MKFPTPDNPTIEDYTIVGLLVHDNPSLIQGIVSGAISQLFEPYFFEKLGEMSPEEAAEYYRNRDWVMSLCDSVAECIENSVNVRAALDRYMSNYLSILTPSSVTNPISPSESANNMLPDDYVCDDNHIMGMARYLVNNLHASTLELIQEIEASTNPIEIITTLIDNVEILSYVGSLPELISWLQDSIQEYYENAYTQVVEDTIACNLWCAFNENCEVSVDTIITGYMRIFTDLLLDPPQTDDYQDTINWLLTLGSLPDLAIVTVMHWFALQSLRFRSPFSLLTGLRTLEQLIVLGSDESDTSHVLCDPCNPVPLPAINYDYRTGQLGSYVYGTSPGFYVANEGYAYFNGTFSDRSFVEHPSLPSLTVSEVRIYQLRSQQSGYAANPAIRLVGYNASNAVLFNVSGTWSQILYDEGLPYKNFVLPSTVNGLVRLQIQQTALNTSDVATWRVYGWGYTS